jgi:excisionase family DNA binding protein
MHERIGLSVQEAANCLSVSERHLRRLLARGVIPHSRLGKRIIIMPETLRSMLAQCARTPRKTGEKSTAS